MRLPTLLAFALFLPAPALAQAPAVPTFEARVRSINDLIPLTEYLGAVVNQAEAGKQFRGLAETLTKDKEGIEGIDPSKPFGAYAFLKPDVITSPVVLLIPAANETRLLRMLKTRLGDPADAGEEKDGLHVLSVPLVSEAMYVRFANGYASVSLRKEALDPASLIKPAVFFAKDDGAVTSAILRVDLVPDELKTLILGQVELRLNDYRAKQEAGETPAQKKFNALLYDAALAMTKSLVEDGKDLKLRFDVDPRSDQITIEAGLTPKAGTALACTLTNAGKSVSLPAAMAGDRLPVLGAAVTASIPEEFQKRYARSLDEITDALLADTPEESKPLAKKLADALLPTLKSGSFDAAGALYEPEGKEPRGVIAAVRVKESKPLLDLLKSIAIFVPPQAATFEFDKETATGVAFHRIEMKSLGEAEVKTVGSRTLWLATSPDMIAASVEDDGAYLRKALAFKPIPAAMLSVATSFSRLLTLTEKSLTAEEIEALRVKVFGQGPTGSRDFVHTSLTGGDRLRARIAFKGKAIQLAILVDEAKKQK